ncbi:MAG: PsbP-related protein [Bacteroidota bacterium]
MKHTWIIILSLLLWAPAQAQKKAVLYKTHTDVKGYTIKYPSNWYTKPMDGAEFFILRPVEEKGQKFRENMNLVQGDAQDLYLVEYIMDATRKMKEQMTDFKQLTGDYIKINGLDFYRMEYEFSYNGKYMMHDVLYLVLKDGRAYSLTGSALKTTFSKFQPIFATMAKSFKIHKKPGK